VIRLLSLSFLMLLLVAAGDPVGAEEFRRVMIDGESGSFLEVDRRSGSADESTPAAEPMRDEILWHRYQTAIFYSTSLSLEERLFTGAWDGVAMHELEGDGTPLWTVLEGPSYTAGAADADVFGSATENAGIGGATINAWQQGSDRPLWSSEIPDCNVPARCVAVARDGSILTVAMNMPGTFVRLYSYDVATGDKISTFDCAPPSSARALKMSDDGSLVVVRASSTLYVVETATGTMRWSGSIGASADPLAFSGDGNVIASGWTALMVYQWNGAGYPLSWSYDGGGSSWYLRCCALSADGNALIAGWNASGYGQNKVQWFDTASSTPNWTYLAEESGGSYQELPSDVAIDQDGEYAVVGAWGDALNTNPEVLVFERRSAAPVFSIDSPGSIYDVAISAAVNGAVYVSACGKNVHANQFGNGGDVYAAVVGAATAIADDRIEWKSALGVFPNPFNPRTTLRCTLPQAGGIELDIFVLDGRLLRRLVRGSYPAGSHDFTWDGFDDQGRPVPSGTYLARLRTTRDAAVRRIVLLR